MRLIPPRGAAGARRVAVFTAVQRTQTGRGRSRTTGAAHSAWILLASAEPAERSMSTSRSTSSSAPWATPPWRAPLPAPHRQPRRPRRGRSSSWPRSSTRSRTSQDCVGHARYSRPKRLSWAMPPCRSTPTLPASRSPPTRGYASKKSNATMSPRGSKG